MISRHTSRDEAKHRLANGQCATPAGRDTVREIVKNTERRDAWDKARAAAHNREQAGRSAPYPAIDKSDDPVWLSVVGLFILAGLFGSLWLVTK